MNTPKPIDANRIPLGLEEEKEIHTPKSIGTPKVANSVIQS